VLHHIPDYLHMVEEMIRVLKPGGVMYIDHEACESYWRPDSVLKEYLALSSTPGPNRSLSRFLKPSNYLTRLRLALNPRYCPEGDIHIWPDDHVEWEKIEELLAKNKCRIVVKENYLNYSGHCSVEQYNRFKDKCVSDSVVVGQKGA
jgi:SAM-dependent methyltransferase